MQSEQPTIEHLPDRPTWDCRVCTRPWPCANAKTDLLAEFHIFTTSLRVYMNAQMADAERDLTSHGEQTPADLYERFFAWTRRRRHHTLYPLPPY